MGAVKRKDPPSNGVKSTKKPKTDEVKSKKPAKAAQLDHFPEPDSSDDNDEEMEDDSAEDTSQPPKRPAPNGGSDSKEFKLDGTSSAEAHAKQRALAKERKAAKPNADIIGRSKKIWERLRRKSHVPKEERKELVSELFAIINGRVRDFVFKHDSVRVIQCALKYANMEQRKNITRELQGDLRLLAESRYGKFLVAKMVVEGDQETRDMIVPEFYGHVKRLINHPEASWIVDDIYRQVASREQKNAMLREWYGAEFAIFHHKAGDKASVTGTEETAELAKILEKNPEKRRPILQYLHQLINSLVQKKMTGFTMLHDAMLQYFLALTPGSEEQRGFLEELMGDIDAESEGGGGDLYKNLAFTKSGSRLVCLALAHGTAKDRKVLLRVFSKDTVDMAAFDPNAKMVLVAGLEVPDDTTMTTKVIYRELLGEKIEDKEERLNKLESVVCDLNARLPILFPISGAAKWLITRDSDKALMEEVCEVRKTSSKKAPELRRKGLIDYMSKALLELVSERAASLSQTTVGAQFISEALLETSGDKEEAKQSVAALAAGDPTAEDHIANQAAAGRMFKTLVLGGNFDPATKSVKLAEPKLGFASTLWPVIKGNVLAWACSASSFVIVALTESEDVPADVRKEVMAALKKGKKQLEAAAGSKPEKGKKEKSEGPKGNAGARILLGKI